MKKKIMRVVLILVFMAGATVFCAPLIGRVYASIQQQQVINRYRKQTAALDAQQKAKVEAADKARNAKIRAGKKDDVQDPFKDNKLLTAQVEKENRNLLQNFGTNNKELANKLGRIMGTIHIPAINTDAPIYNGSSDVQLEHGIGLVPGSSVPSPEKGTHALLTGHRGLLDARLFTDLPKVKKGNKFYIETNGKQLVYQVDQIKVVEPDNLEYLQVDKDQSYVTLITCTPYMVNTHRLLVRGHFVGYGAPKESSMMQESMAAIGAMALVVTLAIVGFKKFRKKKVAVVTVTK